MQTKTRTSLLILAAVIYVVVLASLVQFFIFPLITDAWIGAATQIAFYVVLALPFVVSKPHLLRLYKGTSWQWLLGALLLVMAIGYAMMIDGQPISHIFNNFVRQIVTGPVEELIFRGFIWEESLRLTSRYWLTILLNIGCFAALHVPYVLAQHVQWPFFIGVVVVGGLMCLLRWKTKNIALASMFHAAINLS